MWIMAVLSWVVEGSFYKHKDEVNKLIKAAQFGTLPWYNEQLLKFQYGSKLEWNNNSFEYKTIDKLEQIIKYSAATLTGRLVILKAATQDKGTPPKPTKLNDKEFPALDAYIKQIQPPGVSITLLSLDADVLRLTIEVMYDPQILTSKGILISDENRSPVLEQINAYLNSTEFSGTFDEVSFIDYLQKATGVVKPYLISAKGKAADVTNFTTITRKYEPIAGYMIIDPNINITEYITYEPYI